MERQETNNIKIGNIVMITHAGANYGKRGIVKALSVDGRVGIFIEPIDCEFEFPNKGSKRRHSTDNGLYIFGYEDIKLDFERG